MDAHMDQQTLFNPEKSSAVGDDGFVSCLPSKADKSLAAPSPNECGKKKRVQRAAKLKQCKMDARREQWLSQVSSKVVKPDSCASSRSSSQDDRDEKEMLLQTAPGELDMGTLVDKEGLEDSQLKRRPVGSTSAHEIGHLWSEARFCIQGGSLLDKHKPLTPQQSTACSNAGPAKPLDHREQERKAGQARRLDAPGIWSTSDTSSSQSNSSQVSSSSDDENDEEDWEAVADALHVQATVDDVKPVKPADQCSSLNRPGELKSLSSSGMDKCILKPESKYRSGNCGSRTRADAGRAWRPDDVSRPPTLPRLSKQHSFPLQSGPSLWAASHGSVWGLPPPPSHCPICTEELDTTDSSFVPCSCGFRLCLFCHNRILVGDGRCPGCRKSYNSEAVLKLSRTSSVRPRV
ncbi:hypothetical protein GOP47_0020181 [Adiantum capillus-veneris]|uniref:RING-type domain-containing protein n=1 Tax=Adiantum capillus-veneris TaxID=13818 RepID=A0A9D4ZAC9_ADICA|nr:hypothetical protein GOP47_0020181 [Adiantum capillus-veneris]